MAPPLKGHTDAGRTKIIGNFEQYYRGKIDESGESWGKRALFGTHRKMEDDPALWDVVWKLIMEYVERA